MRRTLKQGETSFSHVKRGLLITEVGEFTVAMYYIPRSNKVLVTSMGSNVTVKLGGSMQLTMPESMWEKHETDIIEAALGTDVFG